MGWTCMLLVLLAGVVAGDMPVPNARQLAFMDMETVQARTQCYMSPSAMSPSAMSQASLIAHSTN